MYILILMKTYTILYHIGDCSAIIGWEIQPQKTEEKPDIDETAELYYPFINSVKAIGSRG